MTRPIKVADVTHYTDRAGRKIKRRFLSPAVMDNARDTAFNESLPSPIEEPRAVGFQVRLVLESLKQVSERRAGLIRELYSPGDVGVESAFFFLDLRNVSLEHILYIQPGEAVAQYAVMHRFQLKPDFVSWFT